jgi:ABC-type bacteriocin/lantibiotic exporter with double-glycine peptidase domain
LKQIILSITSILSSKEKIKLVRLIFFDLVIGILDITFLGLLLVIINFYTKNSAPVNISCLPNSLKNPDSLALISIFLLLFCIKNWFGYIGLKSQNHFFYSVASRLSKRNILNYLKDDYIHFVNVDSSVLIRKISQQPIEFSNYILTNFQQVVSQTIVIFFTIVGIFFYHPTLFLLLFLLLLPPVVLLGWFIRKKLKNIRIHTKVVSEKTIQHLQESISGYVESNIYGKNDFFADRYLHYQQLLNENIATQQTLQSLPSRLIEIFAVFGFFILLAINKLFAQGPTADLLTIGIFMAASYKIIPGIVKILNCTGQIKTYQFTLDDLRSPENKPGEKKESQLVSSISSIKFERVYFEYKDHAVLNAVSFETLPGDFIGISGKSGKGKTTLINLVLGFAEQNCGTIFLNNKITDGNERKRYWRKISYVKQQPFFIHDSILKNITLAESGFDQNKLEEIVAFCGIDELLLKYNEGLEKIIKENGKNISGGERQRIMLARALYQDFDLLILDEPFSEMDDFSEIFILNQLQLLAQQGKMILFITHNKSSLRYCNKIISLNGE